MKKPPVTLENYQAVYEHYAKYNQNPIAWRASHFVLGKLFRPRVIMGPGVADEIKRQSERGSQFVIPSNHVLDVDPTVTVATAERTPLRAVAGNAFIPAKYVLFDETNIKGRATRWAIDNLGAIPIFRNKDVYSDGTEVSPEQKALQKAARTALLDTSIELIEGGKHMSIYPEGERNLDDPTQLLEFGWGLGYIMCNAEPKNDLLTIPMTVHYGTGDNRQVFTPSVRIGMPNGDTFARPEDVVAQLRPVMQEQLDLTVEDFAARAAA